MRHNEGKYNRMTAPPRRQKQWRRIFLVSGLVLVGAIAVQAHEVDDDYKGPKTTRTFDLTGFDSIDVSGVYDVEIEVGESYSIRLEGREREMEYARVEVDGNRLELGQKKRKKRWGNRKSIQARITLPAFNELGVSGVADVNAQNIQSQSFKLRTSGVADVNLSGECGFIKANLSGVSDVDGKELICKDGDVKLSGVSDLKIYTSESIDANVSGVGDVDVYGKPSKVEKSVSKYTASLKIK